MPTDAQELAGIVATARKATEDLEDTDLQRVAFERILDHLLANGGTRSSGSSHTTLPTLPAESPPVPRADSVLADEQQRADAIARYFKIDPEDVEHIFDISSEEPVLNVYTSRLNNSRAVATREIALLVSGARTALGQETTTSHVRVAADACNKLDSGNFMKTLGDIQEISVLGKHGSPNRVVRMRVSGVEKAQTLVQKLVGE